MGKETIDFTVEIAGIPIKIKCVHQENYDFFSSYYTAKKAFFTVEVEEADIEFSRALLARWYGEPKVPYSDRYLENLSIQNVMSKKLLDFHVVLLHGSALCMDGEAYIFTAPSGTGKSTHARFWRETFGDRVWMINDDKPMIRLENGKAIVYGTPWDGKHHLSRNASAPLKAIIWLKRDTKNHIEPLKKAEAFPILMGQGAWSKRGPQKMQAIQLEKELMDTVSLYQLGCNMNPDAALIAWEGIHK